MRPQHTRDSDGRTGWWSRGFWLVTLLTVCSVLAAGVFIPAHAVTSFRPRSSFAPLSLMSVNLSQSLASPSGQPLGEFGTSVAIAGGLVAVGAPLETVGGQSDAGRAYVYDLGTGAVTYTLSSPSPQTNGEFASSAAMSSEAIVVGAPLEAANGLAGAGHAYIFSAATGALAYTLTSPNAQRDGSFGYSVAINGSSVVVGAFSETAAGAQGAGHAYVFNAATGALVYTLTSPNPQFGGGFGTSVGATTGFVVVGAWGEAADGVRLAGRAYTFNLATGGLAAVLTSPNVQMVGEFGYSVAANGNIVAVGAWGESVAGATIAGRVYTFDAATGAPMLTFASPNPQHNGQFGFSVALTSSTLVVGARFEAGRGVTEAGRVYAFNLATGTLVGGVASQNPQAVGSFGFAVAASARVGVVGALLESAGGDNAAGRAYVYSG